jgi:hypothetical protein
MLFGVAYSITKLNLFPTKVTFIGQVITSVDHQVDLTTMVK